MSRLRSRYRETIAPELRTRLQIGSVHAVPRMTKVVINMGVGEGSREHKFIDAAVADLTAITGQRPVVTPRPEVHRQLQDPGRNAGRCAGHPARNADV